MAQEEFLKINFFGPIKEITIENVKPFTFFIGESGSGKSTLLKVLAMMRHMYKQINLRSYLKQGNVIDKTIDLRMADYLRNGGMTDYVKESTEIVYRKGTFEISYTRKGGLKGTRSVISREDLSLEKISFLSDKRGSIASLLANLSDGASLGFYLTETFQDFKKATDEIKELEMSYLGVRYFEKKAQNGTRQFFIGNATDANDIYNIKFEDASSGIQTMTPLAVIAEYFSKHFDIIQASNASIVGLLGQNDSLSSFRHDMNIGDISNRAMHMIIEEPELSLFPKAQRSSLNMLVSKCLNSNINMTLTLATHSPYIINHLNLLIKAYDKEVNIEGAALDYDKTDVYVVENGTLRNMKVLNAHLINTDYLSDDIDEIYDEYDKLDELA
nr:hypothetical protein [uncultured Bacteroides sp.]